MPLFESGIGRRRKKSELAINLANMEKKARYDYLQLSVENYVKELKDEEKKVMLQHEIDGVKDQLDDSLKKMRSVLQAKICIEVRSLPK